MGKKTLYQGVALKGKYSMTDRKEKKEQTRQNREVKRSEKGWERTKENVNNSEKYHIHKIWEGGLEKEEIL